MSDLKLRPQDAIAESGFSTRVTNCLRKTGITTVAELRRLTGADLLNIRDFGVGCLNEVVQRLETSDLHLLSELRVYIAGPYRAPTPAEVDRNIEQAREAMAALLRAGHVPFCPHSMTARFERDYPDIPDEAYLRTDLVWLRLCDIVLMLPGWRDSAGARAELAEALERGLLVFYDLDTFMAVVNARDWLQAEAQGDE